MNIHVAVIGKSHNFVLLWKVREGRLNLLWPLQKADSIVQLIRVPVVVRFLSLTTPHMISELAFYTSPFGKFCCEYTDSKRFCYPVCLAL